MNLLSPWLLPAGFSFASLLQWLDHLPEGGIYLALFVSHFMENLFPPWPSDSLSVLAGFLVAREVISLWYSLAAIIAGNFVGSLVMYYMGIYFLEMARRFNDWFEDRVDRTHLLKRFLDHYTAEEQMKRAEYWLNRSGALLVAVSRFLAGIRYFVAIVAGMARMNILLYTVTFSLGVVVWSSLLLLGGYLLGDQWERLMEWITLYNRLFAAFLALLVLSYIAYLVYRHRRRSRT